MAYLKPASECVCGTCKGKSAYQGEHFYGGWICDCPCHRNTEKNPELDKKVKKMLRKAKLLK